MRILPGIFVTISSFFIIPAVMMGQQVSSSWDSLATQYFANKRTDPAKALRLAEECFNVAKMAENDSLLLESCAFLADAHRYVGDRINHRKFIDQGMQRLIELQIPHVETFLTNSLGLWHWKNGDMDQAAEKFLKVSDLAIQQRDTISTIKAHANLALIYEIEQKYDAALSENISGLQLAEQTKDSFSMALIQTNMSSVYRAKEEYAKAIALNKSSLAINEARNLTTEMVRIYINQGATYHQAGMQDSALWAFNQAKLVGGNQIFADQSVKLDYHIGEVYLAQNEPAKALLHANLVVDSAQKYGYINDVKYGYEMRSLAYENMGDERSAFSWYKKYKHLEDSLFTVEKSNAVSELQVKFETAQKEQALQKTALELSQAETENQKIISWAVIILSALLGAYGILYFIRVRRQAKAEKDRQQQTFKQILYEREQERKEVAKELHDSIGQNLLLMRNTFEHENVPLLDQAIEDIRHLSRELFPWQIEKLGISKALEYLVEQVDAHSEIFFSSEIDDVTNHFDETQEIQIYRIAQECLSNVVKHSQATAAKIKLVAKDQQVILQCFDNGVGVADLKILEPNSVHSLGMTTLRERARSLNGRLTIKPHEPSGLIFEFTIPLYHKSINRTV